jgi:hypothetical protein
MMKYEVKPYDDPRFHGEPARTARLAGVLAAQMAARNAARQTTDPRELVLVPVILRTDGRPLDENEQRDVERGRKQAEQALRKLPRDIVPQTRNLDLPPARDFFGYRVGFVDEAEASEFAKVIAGYTDLTKRGRLDCWSKQQGANVFLLLPDWELWHHVWLRKAIRAFNGTEAFLRGPY